LQWLNPKTKKTLALSILIIALCATLVPLNLSAKKPIYTYSSNSIDVNGGSSNNAKYLQAPGHSSRNSPTPSALPTVTPSPVPSPTATATPNPTVDPSPTQSPQPTEAPSPSPTISPSPTAAPTPTATPIPAPSSTVVSTELINFYSFSDSNINTFIAALRNQGIPEITLRFNAFSEYTSETPPSSGLNVAKKIVAAANAAGIGVNIDCHSWYTTLQNDIFPSADAQDHYVAYVQKVVSVMDLPGVKAFMVMNEPPAIRASAGNNEFILRVIAAAHALTNKPVSVRFMAGYSPSTGHYSAAIDLACDFLARNTYWDPRNPTVSVYGTTEAKLLNAANVAHSQGKEIWITEFGKKNSDTQDQASYVAAFVEYAKDKGFDRVFCWVTQPKGSGETYNIWDGFTPYPAFFELVN
jgi:hypothetical protein